MSLRYSCIENGKIKIVFGWQFEFWNLVLYKQGSQDENIRLVQMVTSVWSSDVQICRSFSLIAFEELHWNLHEGIMEWVFGF